MSFGRHLRALRTAAGLSRAEAFRRARVPPSTLRNWKHDRGFPPLTAVVRLAGTLGVSVERFAEGGKTRQRTSLNWHWRSRADAGRARRSDVAKMIRLYPFVAYTRSGRNRHRWHRYPEGTPV